LMSPVPEPINFQTGRREKRGVITAITISIMAILATSAADAHMASSSYGSYEKVELREMEDKVHVIKSATLNRMETIKQQFKLTEKRYLTMLQALHEVQASIKQGEKSPWNYHWVNLAISSAKRHVTNRKTSSTQ
jgi:D-ribose pyranose/furanose isomerase RbsD